MSDSQSGLVLIDVLSHDVPTVCDATQPFLYADDLGAIRGDGVFETLLVRGDHTCNTKRHEERFISSAKMLDLQPPELQRWREATQLAIAHLRERGVTGDASLRWLYSRGRESTKQPTGYVLVSDAASVVASRSRGVKVMLAERGFSLDLGTRAPWALIGAKTLSYAANMAALRYAKERGFDDVIFTSSEGSLLEGPTSTIILVRGNELLTPNPRAGVLPGTTQAALFATAREQGWTVTPTELAPADLRTADAVWLVSSVRIAVRVVELDGEPLPPVDPAAERQFRQLCDDALAAD